MRTLTAISGYGSSGGIENGLSAPTNSEIEQALRDLLYSVVIAQDNSFSQSSQRLLLASACRAAEVVRFLRIARTEAQGADLNIP